MKGVAAGFFFLSFMCVSFVSEAYLSGIAIQSGAHTSMQVFINGKLYNKTPKRFVRVKSLPGLFHVRIKVLNPYDKRYYIVEEKIRVEKGLEFYYKVVFKKGRRPTLKEIRRYPVYSRYFLDPSLYNRHRVT